MLDALTLDQMRMFVAVTEAGSFRAASVQLARVQSAVSHSIGSMEAQLGVTLFDRSGHRPVLTSEGQALLADIRAILLKVDTMRARARGLGEGLELGISIALDPQFPIEIAAQALKTMQDAYPSVGVRLTIAPMGAPIAALRERRCTMAIMALDMPDPMIELEELAFLWRVAVVARHHPLASRAVEGPAVTAAELADHVQIVGEDPSRLTEGRDFHVLSPRTWRVSDNDTKRVLILSGIGWGNLPIWLVERDLQEGRLVRVPTAEYGEHGETVLRAYIAHRSDEPLGPASRLFRRALIDQVQHGKMARP
ncbi:DNA-binding transcriptional LysR family regulator [Phyllobacterium myrsinacearum]|uniref:LysR family transcriptional regulator n=1 Tax=Phyllobacterium myrsinacearum TaxID=28101 RepID=UPI0010291190|nr:LysR family transcriptional regulator [Phyllobacterium myrsinacearum]RZS77313.1 DNA-binding transcriptional LysR family regulator [Phyllobacterium myrsinacearum]